MQKKVINRFIVATSYAIVELTRAHFASKSSAADFSTIVCKNKMMLQSKFNVVFTDSHKQLTTKVPAVLRASVGTRSVMTPKYLLQRIEPTDQYSFARIGRFCHYINIHQQSRYSLFHLLSHAYSNQVY